MINFLFFNNSGVRGSLSGAKSIDPIDILRSEEGYRHFKADRQAAALTAKPSKKPASKKKK